MVGSRRAREASRYQSLANRWTVEGVGLGVAVEEVQDTTGFDGAELPRIPGQDQPGARGVDPVRISSSLAVATMDASSTTTTSVDTSAHSSSAR